MILFQPTDISHESIRVLHVWLFVVETLKCDLIFEKEKLEKIEIIKVSRTEMQLVK